jgi:hypothetical protein
VWRMALAEVGIVYGTLTRLRYAGQRPWVMAEVWNKRHLPEPAPYMMPLREVRRVAPGPAG